jgi:hypothetical protein
MDSSLFGHKTVSWIFGLTFLGVVTGTAKVFDWVEGPLNDEGKASISRWLKNMPADGVYESWTAVLSRLIDRVFGVRPWSVRFFLRSCLASTITIIVVGTIYAKVFFGSWGPHFLASFAAGTWFFGIASNFVPDYISLCIGRVIVGKMASRQGGGIRTIGLFVSALISTALLAICSVFIAEFIIDLKDLSMGINANAFKISLGISLRSMRSLYWTGLVATPPTAAEAWLIRTDAIFFYSALFTSVWVWIFIIAGFAIKLLRKLSFGWKHIVKFLDVDKHPLGSIGKAAGVLAGICYLFAFIVIKSFQHILSR